MSYNKTKTNLGNLAIDEAIRVGHRYASLYILQINASEGKASAEIRIELAALTESSPYLRGVLASYGSDRIADAMLLLASRSCRGRNCKLLRGQPTERTPEQIHCIGAGILSIPANGGELPVLQKVRQRQVA